MFQKNTRHPHLPLTIHVDDLLSPYENERTHLGNLLQKFDRILFLIPPIGSWG